MTTRVVCRFFKEGPTGTEIPSEGYLLWAPTRRRNEVNPTRVVLPPPFPAFLENGVCEVLVDPTDGTWAWTVLEMLEGGDKNLRAYAVPDVPEVDYNTLQLVDPTTLEATESVVAAWEATVAEVQGYVEAAAASASSASESETAAAGSAVSALGSAGAALSSEEAAGLAAAAAEDFKLAAQAAAAAAQATKDEIDATIASEVQSYLTTNPPADGDAGREVELQVGTTHVQWRYAGDVQWTDLIALSVLIGAPGAPGASAYDVAVSNGFDGTEAEWLASLQGEDGATALAALTDVDLTGITDGDALVWDATAGTWVRVPLSSTYAPRNATTAITLTDASQAIDMPASPSTGDVRTLVITADGGTPSWDSLITWDAGIAPTLSAVAGERDVLTFLYTGADWLGFVSGLFAATPDTTAPTAGTLGMVMDSYSATGTVTGAADDAALAGAPYSFKLDAGAWTDYQTSPIYEWTGLDAATSYKFAHRVIDAAGHITEGTPVTDITSAVPADITPPTAGTLASSEITGVSATLTVSGAADETALHSEPYGFSIDNGATYSGYQSSPIYSATDLNTGTAYDCKHRVRDAAGNVSEGTAITVTTLSIVSDTFDRADSSTSLGAADTGETWESLIGVTGIISGKAYGVSGSPWPMAVVETGWADVSVEADLTFASRAGLVLRANTTTGFYLMARFTSAEMGLYSFDGGYDLISKYTMTPTVGATYHVKVVAVGSDIIVYVDDVAVITTTSAAYATETKHGVMFLSENDRADNFQVSPA